MDHRRVHVWGQIDSCNCHQRANVQNIEKLHFYTLLKRHLACSFLQIFYCNWKIHPRRFEINFCKFLTMSYFVQLSIKILHRSANIYWMSAHKDMKLCRKRGTSVSTLSSAAHILLIKTATRGIFLNFQHIATAYINSNF